MIREELMRAVFEPNAKRERLQPIGKKTSGANVVLTEEIYADQTKQVDVDVDVVDDFGRKRNALSADWFGGVDGGPKWSVDDNVEPNVAALKSRLASERPDHEVVALNFDSDDRLPTCGRCGA